MKRFILLMALLAVFGGVFSQKTYRLPIGSDGSLMVRDVSMSGFGLEYSVDVLTLVSSGDFVSLTIDGTYPMGKIGSPSLPVLRKSFALPVCSNAKVTVKSYSVTEIDLSQYGGKVSPQQRPIRKDNSKPQFEYNAEAYSVDAFIGNNDELAWISSVGKMRGVGIAELNVSPVSYNPVTNVLRVCNDIVLEVAFEGVDLAKTDLESRSAWSPFFKSAYNSLLNKDIFDSYADLFHSPVKMLVVAHEDFESQLQPWIEWKTQKGFYMDINYVNGASASAENIRSWVHSRYSQGVEDGNAPVFLVLVGDVDRIPASAVGDESEEQTDLYYASVDGDYIPEMYCSRMSVENPSELSVVVGKTILYEKYTMPDPSYLGNAMLIAGSDDTFNPYIGQPTINYAVQNYFNAAHGYNNVYAYLDTYDGCYNNLSTGVGYAHYTAHGGETEWCGPHFTNDDVDGLSNTDKYFLAIGNCCLSGKFGYSVPCYGEKMIRAGKKGAYAYIGSSPVTYWYEDYYWALGATSVFEQTPQLSETTTGAFDMMFNDDMFNTVSSIMYVGNLAVTDASESMAKYYWEAYNVLGDGSVMPYNSVPTANAVSHDANIVNGSGSFMVSADPGSYVAVTDGNTILGTALVGISGSVSVPLVSAATSDNVLLVVTRQQRIPHIENVPVVAPEGAYISLVGYSPDEVPYALEDMMGAGYSFTLQLKNVGLRDSEAWLPMTLSCADPNVEILNNSASCSPIVTGETVEMDYLFEFLPSLSIEDGYTLNFTLSVADTVSNATYTSSFDVRVIRSLMQMYSYSVVGDAMPGESFALEVSVTNVGSLAENTEVVLTSLDERLHFDGGDFRHIYGYISRDSIVSRQFPMRADATVHDGEMLAVLVSIRTANSSVADTCYIVFAPCNVAIREFPYIEDFASGEIPECWSQVPNFETAEQWNVVTSDPYDYISQNGNMFVFIKNYSWDDMSNMLVSSKFAFAEGLSATLSFRHVQKEWDGDNDVLSVYYRNSDAGEWQLLVQYDNAYESWTAESIDLPNLSRNYYIAFFADLNYGFGIGLDDVKIEVSGCEIPHVSFVNTDLEHPYLTWTGNAESYSLYKNDELLAELTGNTYELDPDGYDGDDCFSVVAHCEGDEESTGEVCVTGVASAVAPAFDMYPNPASDRVDVVCSGMTGISLYNMLGKVVVSKHVDSDEFSLSIDALPAGVYVVVVDCTRGRQMGKLVIE
ncbi:MAG: T9SS type A sorting domain-containing protein [Bacteroidales bacterium]|nr:T9SS type A sorting domain-containing protein [Bacteroidales bacterium]